MIGMKKGLFGKTKMPGVISGYGGGTFDMDGTQVTPAYSMPQDATMQDGANLGTPAPQKSGGFFGKGGAGRAIAGTVGDALLQQGGMAPVYAPQMQFQQQMAFRQAEEQRRRAEEKAEAEEDVLLDPTTAAQELQDFDHPDDIDATVDRQKRQARKLAQSFYWQKYARG